MYWSFRELSVEQSPACVGHALDVGVSVRFGKSIDGTSAKVVPAMSTLGWVAFLPLLPPFVEFVASSQASARVGAVTAVV